jgi:SAM-dependent methyltransferase
MIHHNTCPLCTGTKITRFQTCTDHFVSKEVFDIFKCENCGFLITQDIPNESEAGRYYESDDYISHSDSKKGITEKIYQFIRRFMLLRKKNLINKITGLSSGSILDIGSGTGHFLSTMKTAGWDIKGIEINEKARKYAAAQFYIDTLSPEKINTLPLKSFDCITLWHVLEHFYDPFGFMEEIAGVIKPGGKIFIALPNAGSFDAGHYGNKWAAYDVPRHLWHFDPSTFSIFALRNRFSIIGKRYLPFDVFYISILSEKYKGSKLALLAGTLNGLIFSFRTIFKKSGCSSVIYILQKTDT